MKDLTLISKRHQRYEKGVPTMGIQTCGRTLIITNADFTKLLKNAQVTPTEGLLVRLINTDVRDVNGNYQEMMQPKLMQVVSDTTNKIEMKGVALNMMGITNTIFTNYSITLHLVNRKVVKYVLHMLDRGIDIEYLDVQP